ncbi:MAG: 16S rRNA (cytosine(1402)-N(4))-methyltransferase, partial [Proteobacteria bacterium]|nr:16S rRNA (cytosine(1402)-N(4))-methyltransferase [Pseudomonadota bacterium]
MMVYEHIPVLRDEVLAFLRPGDGEVFVDCTVGGGGHARAILQAAECRVIGMDRDQVAVDESQNQLEDFGARFVAHKSCFSDLLPLLASLGLSTVDGIVADLGVSSHQLDTPDRGFSFRNPGPVDMRMDGEAPLSAAT